MTKSLPRYRTLIVIILYFLPFAGNAQFHTSGGELSYKFLDRVSSGLVMANRYTVTAKLYKECQESSSLPLSVDFKLYIVNPSPVSPVYALPLGQTSVDNVPQTAFYVTKQDQNACSPDVQPICYYVGVYTGIVEVREGIGEIMVVLQFESRKKDAFRNVSTDGIGKLSPPEMGFTYTCRIPAGHSFIPPGPIPGFTPPNSPVFKKEYPIILCAGKYFKYDFSADDPDGDSLSYSFVPALQGAIYVTPRYPLTSVWPPFLSLPYYFPYTSDHPLGAGVQLDPVTGLISGTGPAFAGRYIVHVEVQKYRNGLLLTRHRKEMQFIFSDCTFPRAQLDSTYRNCKGTTVHFNNYSTGNIASYFWDFGDPTTLADTSHLAEPTYHYPTPGVYTANLFLNRGTALCKDSVSCQVIVDSGLNASFTLLRSLAVCNQAVYDFTNTSTPGSHPIISYAWDFGEPTTTGDVSSLLSPTYTYPTEGNKLIRLIIKTDIGCSDTAFKNIFAFKSLMQAPNDTTICNLDPIPLVANTNGYPGTFSWSPNYNISSLTSPAPIVNPQVDTTYHVTFTDGTGCVTKDSVRVKVRNKVNVLIDHIDTTICRSDVINLLAIHDGLSVTWTPSPGVIPINPDGSEADASPLLTTPVIATSHFGSCVASDTMRIKVVPQPQVTVNGDTTVCVGAPVYLQATGGAFYLWSPAATLNNALLSNPIAHPVEKTIYAVSVYDTLGCPKHTIAYVKVTTFRGLISYAEKDTMIVEGEPVQLSGSGGQYYQWSPPQYLSSTSIPDPIARPYRDITYVLTISNDDNCADKDSVRIRVFKDPDIYVPTAFTPNNDGKNDVFKVFPVGFDFGDLKIFDRWGGLVFTTSNYQKGWDGKNKGVFLTTGTFVWIVTGKNKKTGASITKKGMITLIR